MRITTALNDAISHSYWGFIHEVTMGPVSMDDSDRIKGVLDGSIDPSEISGDAQLYSMAERIYGREALEGMGIEPPVSPPESGLKATNGNGGVEIPTGNTRDTLEPESKKKVRRRVVLPGFMFLLLFITTFNVALGIGTALPICEDEAPVQELELTSSTQLHNNTLSIVWTMKGLNNGSSYTLDWQISQNGSTEVVDNGNSTWVSHNVPVRFDSQNWHIDNPPYSYLSTLYEDGVAVAFSNGSGESITALTDEVNGSSYCEMNTRLIWTQYSDIGSKDAWGESGTGGIVDGALMMLFALLMLITARKRT